MIDLRFKRYVHAPAATALNQRGHNHMAVGVFNVTAGVTHQLASSIDTPVHRRTARGQVRIDKARHVKGKAAFKVVAKVHQRIKRIGIGRRDQVTIGNTAR